MAAALLEVLMKEKRQWFHLYPESTLASNLSIASGGVKLFSILLLVLAVPATLAVVSVGFRILMASNWGSALFFMMDELDEEIFMVFFLWCLFFACRYVASVLQGKAELTVARQPQMASPAPVAAEAPMPAELPEQAQQ